MTTKIGARLQSFSKPGSMGVVKDTTFIRCYWPFLMQPTALFAPGSSGLQVMGSPTPRNVVFPPDTVFLDFYPDALYPAEQAVWAAFPARSPRAVVEFSDAEAQVYLAAYDKAVASFPPTHSIHPTRPDCHFLLKTQVVANPAKPDFFVTELAPQEVDDLITGKVAAADLSATKDFNHVSAPPDEPDTIVYQVDPKSGALVDIGMAGALQAEPVSAAPAVAVVG
jgi:hypothetical protein